MTKWILIALGLIVSQMGNLAFAQTTPNLVSDKPKLRLQLSPYTYHFNADTNHKNVVLVGVEREYADKKLDGLVLFSNSFGQESVYIYPWGGTYPSIMGVQALSFKWTAGLLYGYKEPYQDKVPLNYKGFSPGLIFGLAYDFKPGWSGQLNMLGTAGLGFQLNIPLD